MKYIDVRGRWGATGRRVEQLASIFGGHKTIVGLLADAGFDPSQMRDGRPFASQWAWSDGRITVASVWAHEVEKLDDDLIVRFRDPTDRAELTGLRRSRAIYMFNVLSSAAGGSVRVVLQQRRDVTSAGANSTKRRALDPAHWVVKREDGEIVLLRLEAPVMDSAPGDGWTDDELHAAVVSYLDMQSKIKAGIPIVKSHYYAQLAQQFGRTAKSFEFRMQNISYVLALKGRDWIRGLPPATHVGSSVSAKIEEFLGRHEGTLAGQAATFEVRVSEASRKLKAKPTGSASPAAVQAVSLQFVRDPEVKAWVLRLAQGICECCGQPAPFSSVNGPFLEVHHVQRLADRGADTVENAIAICPNCHRRLHYSLDAAEQIDRLYQTISRLIKPGFSQG